ncbi:glycerophosphoryl diester phosphodiesterase [Kribbella amoyensis]|uniref:Glycerophosphoryl diester phosphodiesterase n=1 Tax=Kribbella amoyensis TaxID=996641 RepID=A0A561BV25_9ACTN|nr:glycerophosphodiester phosphodiesterase family protein [Kribbella amoyensis]TWD82719.1 glycerophosphoryl diester phosphodiesterase [Kribbella amoyensis]
MRITRRTTLGWLGGLTAVALTGGCRGASAADPGSSQPVYGLTDWVSDRGDHYLIGHRGAGDVFPEHSMESYQAAVDWGARALEVSVGLTADNALVCLQDQSLERTTNLTGALRGTSLAPLRNGWLDIPRLGPAWQYKKLRVPLFEDVLKRFGGRVILCVDARDDRAYEPMMSMIARNRLETSVLVRTTFRSIRLGELKKQGLGVLASAAGPAELTGESVQTVASLLSPRTDALVLPTTGVSADLTEVAVAAGVPVWASPIHRRSELERYRALGVAGAVTPDLGYLNGTTEIATSDQWARGAAVAGELTRDPADDRYALRWNIDASVTLGAKDVQHFVTLGNLGPVTASAYAVEFEAAYDVLPAEETANLTLAFGHQDDRYYEHRLGTSDGYHAILQADGELGLYAHRVGKGPGTKLGTKRTAAPVRKKWMRFRLEVTPTQLTWIRQDDAARITVTDPAFRGGYLHLGRASTDGALSLRGLKVVRSG